MITLLAHLICMKFCTMYANHSKVTTPLPGEGKTTLEDNFH